MSAATEASDSVRLTLPAAPEYIRLARLTTAGLASTLGFSYEEIEDLRIAVDELCYLLVGPHGWPGTVLLRYLVDGGVMTVEGSAKENGQPAAPTPFSARILAATVDHHEIVHEGGAVTFRMVRRHRPA